MILNVANSFLLERFDKPGFWSKSKTLKRSQDWFIYSREKHKISGFFFFVSTLKNVVQDIRSKFPFSSANFNLYFHAFIAYCFLKLDSYRGDDIHFVASNSSPKVRHQSIPTHQFHIFSTKLIVFYKKVFFKT